MDTLPGWLELWWLRESPRHSSKVSSRCSCSRQTIRCTTAGAWETRCHDERCRKASASFQLPSNGAREKAKNEDGRDGSRDGYRLLGCRHAHAHAHARPSKQRALLDTSARHDRWERRLYTMRPRLDSRNGRVALRAQLFGATVLRGLEIFLRGSAGEQKDVGVLSGAWLYAEAAPSRSIRPSSLALGIPRSQLIPRELSEQDRAAAPAAVSLLFASTPVTSTRAVQLADSLAHTPLFSPHPLHRAAPLHSSPAPANPPLSHSNSAAFWPTRHTNSFIPAQPGCSAPCFALALSYPTALRFPVDHATIDSVRTCLTLRHHHHLHIKRPRLYASSSP
ncbi:hypothetical protein L1887_61621 [Cichorium endivia]|nr:hypothetical protein L1887_61621 [Cichorium endivia]